MESPFNFYKMINMKKIYYFILITVLVISSLLVGCKNESEISNNESIITDGVGRKISLVLPIKSAVVANSHNTELINSIGNAIDKVIGVDSGIYNDKFAYGGRFKEENYIGFNQRALNYERIIELNPDVLLISDNGYWQEAESRLAPFGIKVIVFNAYHSDEFEDNCKLIGKLFNEEKAANDFYTHFIQPIKYIEKQLKDKPKKSLYIEYRRQNTTIAPGRPYAKMVEYTGAKNIFDDVTNPNIDGEEIILRNPEYIVKISDANVRGTYNPPTIETFIARKNELVNRAGWEDITAVKNDHILLLSHYAFGGASELIGSMYIAKYMYPEYLPKLNPEKIFNEWVTRYQGLPSVHGHTYPRFDLDK